MTDSVDDIHYEWELVDPDGEWVAGGSGNDLDRTRAEGRRYLVTYLKDGPHTLILREHRTTTIEEVAA